jgi:hypothetical protein
MSPSSAGSGSSHSFSVFSSVFVVEKFDGVEDKRSGDITTVDVQALFNPLKTKHICFI